MKYEAPKLTKKIDLKKVHGGSDYVNTVAHPAGCDAVYFEAPSRCRPCCAIQGMSFRRTSHRGFH